MVGHELRSPLTVIRTALGSLTDDLDRADLTPDTVRMLEIALRNARRLEVAVNHHLEELENLELQAAAPVGD
jgi:signal transduction histidine kinase